MKDFGRDCYLNGIYDGGTLCRHYSSQYSPHNSQFIIHLQRGESCIDHMTTSMKLEMGQNHMTERIFNLTLEIIYLLTGEDCTVVMKSSIENNTRRRSHRLSTRQRQGSITKHPPTLLTLQKTNDHKILEVTKKITELLTGEVDTMSGIPLRNISLYLQIIIQKIITLYNILQEEIPLLQIYIPDLPNWGDQWIPLILRNLLMDHTPRL
ncbi:uncharacterized protein LOC143955403 [Lithobates pipiens]